MASGIALREVFRHDDLRTEIWFSATAVPEGTLMQNNGRFAVALSDSEGVQKPDFTIFGSTKVTGIFQPGASNWKVGTGQAGEKAVGVATDGTWEFDTITGATTSTAQGTPVYINAGVLTMTASGGTKIGVVNYPGTYAKVAGKLPVKIGV